MKKMKRNILLIPFIAVMTLLVVGFATAGPLANNIETKFNDVYLSTSGPTMSGSVDDTVPIRVTFDAIANMSDVKIKISMEGHRDDVSASTKRFDIVDGSRYTRLVSLELPSDADDLTKEYTLYVEIVSASDKSEETYTIKLQRNSYTLEILSVDYSSKVSAGDVFPVSIVAKNNGYNRADDVYVVISIPGLGISTRGYLGDLIPVEDYNNYDDEEDSVYKTVYLKVPTDSKKGIYDINVEIYNSDSETSITNLISIDGDDSDDSDKTLNIDGKTVADGEDTPTSVVALTVILVIIFVVLLAVLAVLLTRKERPIEEVETSYY